MYKKLQKTNKLELGSVLHEIWWARHQARPASIKRRTKPGTVNASRANEGCRARFTEPGILSSGPAKGPTGLNSLE